MRQFNAKKEDKVGNKEVYKKERQRKKYRGRDWKSSSFGLYASAIKKFNFSDFYIPLVGNMPFVLKPSSVAILMIISQKSVQERKW